MLTLPWKSGSNTLRAAPLVQVSRLELARTRDVPGFLLSALRIRRLVLRSSGAGGISLRAQPLRRTFWTLSTWRDEAAIGEFMRTDLHRSAMAKYHDRMADSHFHTWTVAQTPTGPPSWCNAHQRYEQSKEQQ